MTTPEARLVRLETKLDNALTDLAEQIGAFDRDHERLIQHGERIEKTQHDIRNLKMSIEECRRHGENIGRAAHDLVAQERAQRIAGDEAIEARRVAAVEKISQVLIETDEKRRLQDDERERKRAAQIDTWFKRLGYAAWAIAMAVFVAYLGTVFV